MSTWAATHPWTTFWGAWDRLLVSVGFCWCLLLSWIVPRYLGERIVSIWVKCMYVYGVWMCVREFWSFHALYGAANALYWKCLKRQNSTYLTLLKHQNTKTSLYKLSKNHWVIALLENFGSVRRKLQSTVSLDHPVVKPIQSNAGGWKNADWIQTNTAVHWRVDKFIEQRIITSNKLHGSETVSTMESP